MPSADIENATPNRGWPLPYKDNYLSFDIPRLLAMFGAIDEDMANAFAALALRAPIYDAALTGAPTAPTPAPDSNDQRIATTAFVTSMVATFTPSNIDAAEITIGTLPDARLSFTVSATARTLLDDNTTGDMRTTLGVYSQAQVDSLLLGVGKRGAVRAATNANIVIATALNSGDAIDGVTLADGDLVLVKSQTSPAQNGIYVAGVAPARSIEFDTFNEHAGVIIVVKEGTTNAETAWMCSSNDGGTLGTTAISFSKLSIAGEIFAANNLSDVASALTAFNNIKQAATTSYAGAVELADNTETTAGVDNSRAVTPAGLAAREAARAYQSAQQTITTLGALTLTHGLGVIPKRVEAVLVCTIADAGYAVGEELYLGAGLGQTASGVFTGVSLYATSTEVKCRFGNSGGGVFLLGHATTGARVELTNASWRMVVRAWA